MSTSQRTFNQVKSILGKLDQRIDSLRSARTTDRVLAMGGGLGVGGGGGVAGAGLSTTVGAGEASVGQAVGQAVGRAVGQGTVGGGGIVAGTPTAPSLNTTVGGGVVRGDSSSGSVGSGAGAGKVPESGPKSIYGRATPIRPTGT
jgi:hypothetical protein